MKTFLLNLIKKILIELLSSQEIQQLIINALKKQKNANNQE